MDKMKIRAVIQFFYRQGKGAKDIHERISKTLGDCCISYESVRLWVNEFKRGRKCIADAPRQGGPRTAVTTETVNGVRQMIGEDKQIKVRDISDVLGISAERVHFILRNHLKMKKICSCWVSDTLNATAKGERLKVSKYCLKLYTTTDPADFLQRIIIVGQASIVSYAKQYSEEVDSGDEPQSKKVKHFKADGTVMATIIWDAKGLLMIDYYDKSESIGAERYSKWIHLLKSQVAEKRLQSFNNKFILQHDGILCSNKSFEEQLDETSFEILPHPNDSPDLTPTHYYLLPKLRTALTGRRFSCKDEIVHFLNDYFSNIGPGHFYDGISSLEKRWNKCIENDGNYTDK